MASIEWDRRAQNELEEARLFLSRESSRAADSFLLRVVEAVDRLHDFPQSGRAVPEFGRQEIREIVVANYRVLYRVEEDRLRIVKVQHGARPLTDYPE